MISRRHASSASLCLVCILLSGCLEYDEVIVLHGDGTGYIDVRYDVPRALLIADWLMPGEDVALPIERSAILEMLEDDGLTVENLRLASTRTGTRVSLRIVFEDLQAFFEVDVIPNQTFDFEVNDESNWEIRRALVGIGEFRERAIAAGTPPSLICSLLAGGYLRFRVRSEIPIIACDSSDWQADRAEWLFPLVSLPRDVVMEATLENPLPLANLMMVVGGTFAGIAVLVWLAWQRRLRRRSSFERAA